MSPLLSFLLGALAAWVLIGTFAWWLYAKFSSLGLLTELLLVALLCGPVAWADVIFTYIRVLATHRKGSTNKFRKHYGITEHD